MLDNRVDHPKTVHATRRVVQLSKLKHIDHVEPIGDQDFACLDEVRRVLEKHGVVDRFGLALLHRHFPIADDEVLVEYCDDKSRTLIAKPIKHSDLDKDCCLIPTVWVFGESSHRPKYCPTCQDGTHYGYKDVRV